MSCPKCGGNPLHGYDGDQLYNMGCYNVDVPVEIKCGSCDEKIWMKPFESIDFEYAESEDEL